jgi:hypothetical protein
MCTNCAGIKFVVALPPAETAVSALCAGILSTRISVFASLFAKSEQVSGQRPEKLTNRKMCFAHSLQIND